MDEDFFDDGEIDQDLMVVLEGAPPGAGGPDLPSDGDSFPRTDALGAAHEAEGSAAGGEDHTELSPMFFPVSSSQEAARINHWRAQYQSFRLGGAQGAHGRLRVEDEDEAELEEAPAAGVAAGVKKKRLFVSRPRPVRRAVARSGRSRAFYNGFLLSLAANSQATHQGGEQGDAPSGGAKAHAHHQRADRAAQDPSQRAPRCLARPWRAS